MNIFIWIEIILISCFFLVNIIIGLYPFSYNLKNSGIIRMIVLNLKGELIYSFYRNYRCYIDEGEEELVLDDFGNTPEFCNCQGTILGNSECPSSKKDCKTINSIPHKSFRIINSEKICVKKLNNKYIDFLRSNDIIPKDKECPVNYTSCGIIDTLERKLCMKNAKNCPIKRKDIENNNNTSEQILSVFKLRPNYPCVNPMEKNWIYHGDLAPLTKFCTKNDFRYEKIDKFNTTLYDLYKDNDILNILPNYDVDELKKENVYLYARNFFGLDKEKAVQFSDKQILSFEDTINTCNTLMKVVTYILIATIFFLAFASKTCSKDGKDFIQGILCMLGIYAIPASILYFIVTIIIFNNHNKIISMLDIGSDEYITSIINDALSGSVINYVCPLISFISFPLIIILGVIILCTME
jgi:hypothetical protein